MTRYSSWSARQLKQAGTTVNAQPLWELAALLDQGEQTATAFEQNARAALSFLQPGWTGEGAAAAHKTVTTTANQAGVTAQRATSASAAVTTFADSMAHATYEVSIMPASDPPKVGDYLLTGLLSPVTATVQYLSDAHRAEQQRQALVGKIAAMDAQGTQMSQALANSFDAQTGITAPPAPPADLPPEATPAATTHPAGTAPSAAAGGSATSGSATGSGVPAPPGTGAPAAAPSSAGSVPGVAPVPSGGTGATLPQSAPATPAPAPAGGSTPPTATPVGITPGGGVGLPGVLLGGAVLTGGASAALGASTVGLPRTVPGGWAPGTVPGGTAGEPVPGTGTTGSGSATGRGGIGGRPLGGAAEPGATGSTTGRAGGSGYGPRPGTARPGAAEAGGQPLKRTVGRSSSRTASDGERPADRGRGGLRRGVVDESTGGRGIGETTRGTAGRTPATRGSSPRPSGRGGPRRDEDDTLRERPDFLVESDEVWGDGRTVARGVLGERPEIEEDDR